MLINFWKSVTLICAQGETCVITSLPQPMGDNNFVDAALLAQVMFDQGATGSAQLDIQAQGSNDGENWFNITGFTAQLTLTGIAQDSSSVTAAFIRFTATLSVQGGTPGDWVVATFDLRGNLLRTSV